jgi:hypothetical protein
MFFPLKPFLVLGKERCDIKSGDLGGFGMTVVLFLARNLRRKQSD